VQKSSYYCYFTPELKVTEVCLRSHWVQNLISGQIGPCPQCASNNFLDYTMAVVVFAETVDGRHVIESHQISKDISGVHTFGYEFKSCATPGCQPVPADMRMHNNGPRVHLHCLKCKWRSSRSASCMHLSSSGIISLH